MKLIYVVQGGLGNQLFQYCYFNYITESAVFDDIKIICASESDLLQTKRDFGLKKLFLEKQNAILWRPSLYKYILLKIIVKCIGLITKRDDVDISFGKSRFVYGYWQSEDYVSDKVVAKLRNFFNIPELEKKFSNRLIVHFRRGDYLRFPNNTIYKIPSYGFYDNAAKFIKAVWCGPLPKVYIYSDDFKNVEQSLFYLFDTYEKSSNEDLIADFREIAAAKYAICSNSTFCWWARRISEERQYSIFPKTWFLSYRDLNENLKFGVWID